MHKNVQPKTRASGRTTERLASFERHWLALAASVWRRWRRLAAFQTLLRNSGIASNLRDAQPEKRPDFSAQRRAIIDGHNLLRQGRRTLTPSTRSPHGARSSGEALTNIRYQEEGGVEGGPAETQRNKAFQGMACVRAHPGYISPSSALHLGSSRGSKCRTGDTLSPP